MKRKVLNRGFIQLNGMSADDSISPPLEHIVFSFHIKCPIFVARQWFQDRRSSFNEISEIKSIVSEDFYVPSSFQSSQSGISLPEVESNILYKKLDNFNKWAVNFYGKLIKDHFISNDQARMILPQSMFTEFYWTVNAKSLMNFLRHRLVNKSKWEMQQYAEVLLDMFKEKLPVTAEVFLKREFKQT